MSLNKWKKLVKMKVNNYAFQELIISAQQLNHLHIDLPTDSSQQKFITELPTKNARKIFQIRTGTIDLRAVRRYKYGTNNMCRLCSQDQESVEQIVNDCTKLHRLKTYNVKTTDPDELLQISNIVLKFDELIETLFV